MRFSKRQPLRAGGPKPAKGETAKERKEKTSSLLHPELRLQRPPPRLLSLNTFTEPVRVPVCTFLLASGKDLPPTRYCLTQAGTSGGKSFSQPRGEGRSGGEGPRSTRPRGQGSSQGRTFFRSLFSRLPSHPHSLFTPQRASLKF